MRALTRGGYELLTLPDEVVVPESDPRWEDLLTRGLVTWGPKKEGRDGYAWTRSAPLTPLGKLALRVYEAAQRAGVIA